MTICCFGALAVVSEEVPPEVPPACLCDRAKQSYEGGTQGGVLLRLSGDVLKKACIGRADRRALHGLPKSDSSLMGPPPTSRSYSTMMPRLVKSLSQCGDHMRSVGSAPADEAAEDVAENSEKATAEAEYGP